MNTLEFAKNIPAEKLAEVFKDFFEQHMAVYDMLKGVEFISINSVSMDTASIMYSIRLLDSKDKENLAAKLQGSYRNIYIYGKEYRPHIFLNGDLLCITIDK